MHKYEFLYNINYICLYKWKSLLFPPLILPGRLTECFYRNEASDSCDQAFKKKKRWLAHFWVWKGKWVSCGKTCFTVSCALGGTEVAVSCRVPGGSSLGSSVGLWVLLLSLAGRLCSPSPRPSLVGSAFLTWPCLFEAPSRLRWIFLCLDCQGYVKGPIN